MTVDVDVDLVFDGAVDVSATFDGFIDESKSIVPSSLCDDEMSRPKDLEVDDNGGARVHGAVDDDVHVYVNEGLSLRTLLPGD